MAQVVNLSVSSLKDHKQNTEYFDDIDGDNYQNFVKSIENDGVITPIIVSNDMTILSGHQRVRACRELSIETISAIIRDDIVDENDKLKKLLATNFGRIKNDPAKVRKVVVKYVELCGFKNGGNRKSECDNRALNQTEIAKQLGISERTLQELLELERKLTPEIKTLMDSNIINPTTAKKVWCKIDKQTQTDIIKEFGTDIIKKLTMRETQSLVDEYSLYKSDYEECKKELENQKKLKETSKDLENNIKTFNSKIKDLETQAFNKLETLRKLQQTYEDRKANINNQSNVLTIISSALDSTKRAKANLEQALNKYVREGLTMDEVGLDKLDDEIFFLSDMSNILLNFKNRMKEEVVNYEIID